MRSLLADYALAMDAVHLDGEGLGETDVTDVLGLVDGWHFVEDFLTVDAVATEGVDGEVGHAERGEVLEEVGALGGINLEALQAGLYDDAGS